MPGSQQNRLGDKEKRRIKADFELILIAYRFRGYNKGAKGIHMRLLHMDPPVVMNVKKIYRLMKKFHLVCGIRKANPYRRMVKVYISEELTIPHGQSDHLSRRFRSLISERDSRRSKSFL